MYHAYLILLLAIISENVGTAFLKGSSGLSRPVYVIGALSGYVVNFLMMGQVLALLPPLFGVAAESSSHALPNGRRCRAYLQKPVLRYGGD